MEIHKKLNHRKTILENLKEEKINVSNIRLDKILKECEVCMRKDKKKNKTCRFVEVDKPGDKIGIDILELTSGEKILTAIEYFSIKIFAISVATKEANKTVKFLDRIKKELTIKNVLSDNGREFKNKLVDKWMEENKVTHLFSIPYYHQSNGRIERANRTIRNACRKTPGHLKIKLQKIVENYNNVRHRGIGMSPNEALKEENFEKVKEHEIKYKAEFKSYDKKAEKFKIGDIVLVKNELRQNKMDDEFSNTGNICTNEYGDVYNVKMTDGMLVRKHASQLRGFKEGKL